MTKLIAYSLVEWMDETGACYPSHTSIAERAGVSVATIKRAIRELKDAGLLRVKSGGGRSIVNHYQAVLKGVTQTPYPRKKGSETLVKGFSVTYEPEPETGAAPNGAPVFVEHCITGDETFETSDENLTACEGCRQ